MRRNEKLFLLILVMVAATWLRMANLGYSEFQGDEIKALFLPREGQGLADFLLMQRKGPVQFLITYLYGIFDPLFSDEFLVRLPFSLAGIGSVFVFYRLIRIYFGETIAFISSFFMATNGIFVAFSRIVQYQSIVVLCSLSALYFLSRAVKTERWRVPGLYAGMLSLAVGMLTHFDAVFVVPPAVFLLYRWYIQDGDPSTRRRRITHLAAATGLAAAFVALFYMPYAFFLSRHQLSYWSERIAGSKSDSLATFRLYNPTIVPYLYALMLIAAVPRIRRDEGFTLVWLWLAPSFIFMEAVMSSPRTHIYVYLMPLFVLASHGLETCAGLLARLAGKWRGIAVRAAGGMLLCFLFFLSHSIFVDHRSEYPWEDKTFLLWSLHGAHIDGIMGFPYHRQWKAVGDYICDYGGAGIPFVTNERRPIASFYIAQRCADRSGRQEAVRKAEGTYAVIVKNPQSGKNDRLITRLSSGRAKPTLLQAFRNEDGKLLASLYRVE